MSQHRDIQTPLQAEYMGLVRDICRNEPAAFRWFTQAMDAALLWDHVIDGDPIDRERANATFQAMTMDWILNDFFYRNRLSLVPVMNGCVSAWANSREGSDAAYMLYTQLPAVLIMLLHGSDNGRWMPAIHANIARERFQDMRRDHPPFFIVGLPRTRSAWFSAFFTDGPVTCHHELVRNIEDPTKYVETLLATKTPVVGDASPMLPMYYGAIKDQLPKGHKVVFINRSPEDARAAFRSMLEQNGIDPAMHLDRWGTIMVNLAKMEALCPDAMTFNYTDLDKEQTIREIAEYATGLQFNPERWRAFDELKITAIPKKVMANQRLIK